MQFGRFLFFCDFDVVVECADKKNEKNEKKNEKKLKKIHVC